MHANLFPDCVLPACTTPVAEPGQACPECVTAFGPMLRTGGAPLTEEEIRERDDMTNAIYQHRAMMRGYRTTPAPEQQT